VVRDGDWTRNVCGFWNVGFWSLLLRSSRPNMTVGQWYKEFNNRVSCKLLLVDANQYTHQGRPAVA
jgi:hypothetical protein